MSTTTRSGRPAVATPVAVAARAAAAAVLAVVVTFALDHRDPAGFGLAALGGYLVLQAVVLAAACRAWPGAAPAASWSSSAQRCRSSAAVIALTGLGGGVDLLRPLEAVVFLVVGALEIIGGLRRSERAELSGDAVVVGGLQVLVGVLLIVLNADPLFAVGVLGAWGAIVAVYLGISAANLRRRAARMSRPSLRDRLKPLELVGISAVLGVFAGVIAMIGTRSVDLALILAGVAFIVALLVLAMLALAAGGQDPGDQSVPVLDRQKPEKRARRRRS